MLTSFATALLKNCATAFGSGAGPKSVFALVRSVGRLICPFHYFYSLLFVSLFFVSG